MRLLDGGEVGGVLPASPGQGGGLQLGGLGVAHLWEAHGMGWPARGAHRKRLPTISLAWGCTAEWKLEPFT